MGRQMVNQQQFRSSASKAVLNIIKHGDTDVFPFPFENHAFFDKQDAIVDLITEYNNNFEDYLARYPPTNVSCLAPITYSGFRWATQLDPIWNAHLLACVLSISNEIEAARFLKSDDIVFSYRYAPNKKTGDLFDRNYGWPQFIRASVKLSEQFAYVVACDISEFYPRLSHHRLENALKQVAGDTAYPKRILAFLSNYSNHNSFGLPIGGPAARILSELTINQVDRLLALKGITFTRFADDYHLFATSREDAYHHLIFLSEKLLINQGLSLQKSKTRILTSTEFRATNPIRDFDDASEAPPQFPAGRLLQFSLRFDPYSPTAQDDYERLRREIARFDIIGLLKEELAKSQVHAALARKVISAIRYLDPPVRDDAVLSILENCELLYPIFSGVLLLIAQVYDELSEVVQEKVISILREKIIDQSHIFRVDLHLSFAIRVIDHRNCAENQALLQQIYDRTTSPLVRRDIILVMARWGVWSWLSDQRNRFRTLSPPERRAFIVASYVLKDEGQHWRSHIRSELDPFEELIIKWAGEKAADLKWKIPL
jgi:hypothetical protein